MLTCSAFELDAKTLMEKAVLNKPWPVFLDKLQTHSNLSFLLISHSESERSRRRGELASDINFPNHQCLSEGGWFNFKLRWLEWPLCPCGHIRFEVMRNLVYIDLSYSNISNLSGLKVCNGFNRLDFCI